MASDFDPTTIWVDLELVNKAAIRSTSTGLGKVKTELDHGGFVPGTPANYTRSPADDKTASHLAGVDAALGQRQALDALLTAIANLSMVADRYIYGTGEDAVALGTITSFARGLLDDADEATARATLGAAPVDSPVFTTAVTVPDGSISYTEIQDVSATDRLLGRDTANAGDIEELTVGGGIEFTGSGGIQRSALTGAVTAAAGSGTTAFTDNAVTNGALRDSAALSVIGRTANSTGDPGDIAAGTDGHVLRRSGTALEFGQLAAGALPDAIITSAMLRNSTALSVIGRSVNSTGVPADIAASAASGAVLRESGSTIGFGTIATAGVADAAITYAKIQNVSATSRLLGRVTADAGVIEELTAAQAKTLLALVVADVSGAAPLASPAFTGNGSESFADAGNKTGAASFAYGDGAWQKCVATGNITSVAITGAPASGRAAQLLLEIHQDGTGGKTIAWGAAFRFPGGTDYTLSTAAGAIDFFTLVSRDGGTTWHVFEAGKAMAA